MTDEEIRVECLRIAVQIVNDCPGPKTAQDVAKELYQWVKEAEQVESSIYSYDNTKECSTDTTESATPKSFTKKELEKEMKKQWENILNKEE